MKCDDGKDGKIIVENQGAISIFCRRNCNEAKEIKVQLNLQ